MGKASFPDDPPLFLARTPYAYFDPELVRQELAEAGFAEVSVATVRETSRAPSARHVAVAYCQGTPPRGEIEERDADGLEAVTERAAAAIASGTAAGRSQRRSRVTYLRRRPDVGRQQFRSAPRDAG